VTLILAIAAGLSIVMFASTTAEYSLLDRLERGAFSSRAEAIDAADSSDRRQGALAIADGVVSLAGGIVFIVWFRRMHMNLRALGVIPRHGSGWAIGGWFVPFLNFVRPKQIANDIYKGSSPDTPPNDPNWMHRPVSPLLDWWWGFWIASTILWRTWDNTSRDAAIDSLQTSSMIEAISHLVTFVAAVLAIVVVRMMNERQEQRAQRFSVGQPGSPITLGI
jgi:hypothetical protein